MDTTETTEIRVRIIEDPEPDYSYLDQTDEHGAPLFGDLAADDLVSFAVITETCCPCCGHWDSSASLWNIDVLDEPALYGVTEGDAGDGTYAPDEIAGWLEQNEEGSALHYLALCALGMLAEARAEVPA